VNFLNVGPWELTVIMIIAILLVGPKRMIEIARTIGQMTGQLRRLSNEFTSTLQAEVLTQSEAEGKEGAAGEDEAKETGSGILHSLTEPFVSLRDELQATGRETREALESIASGESGPIGQIQTELEATVQETRQTLNAIEHDLERESTQDNSTEHGLSQEV
jgi:Sec-independent protein translocase protein TatA